MAERAAAAGGEAAAAGRKARGRPRLTESDRARRRLESRKKYDVRRVYLGEAHGPWVDLRRRSGWSDAKLAAYLISLERGQRSGRHGKPWEQVPKKTKRKKRRRRNVNCLKNAVIWYEDHQHRCPYEPHLAELDPTFGLYTTAVWQCEAGHRYFQDLHSPLKPLSDSDPDSDAAASGQAASSSDSSDSDSCSAPGPAAPSPAPQETLGTPGCGPPDGLEAVVCLPLPMQVGAGPEALGEVVAGCPVPGLAPGPQVIIIAGPAYDALAAEGLRLSVAASGGEPGPGALLEGLAAFSGDPAALAGPDAKKEKQDLFALKEEEQEPGTPELTELTAAQVPDGAELDRGDMSAIIYEIPKEPEKRRRSKRSRVTDADGLLEMFHCPYEGCSQVYVALSSFQECVNSPVKPAGSPSRGRTTWRFTGARTQARRHYSARSAGTSAGSAPRSTGT